MEASIEKPFPPHPKIIYMGTPYFAVPGLNALIRKGHDVQAVVTQPDRPRGRGKKVTASAVKQTAQANGLEVFQPESASDASFLEVIRGKDPDILVVVAYGQILRRELLEIPRWGVLNIHASLLPKYRGAAPIQWAIINDDTETGLTAMRMEEALDSGPVLLQTRVAIVRDETAGHLHDRLAELSGDFLVATLKAMAEKRLQGTQQDHDRATYAPKIDRRMSRINWKDAPQKISSLIRGLDPWPGALSKIKGREVKLFSSRVLQEKRSGLTPGRILRQIESGIEVETGGGSILIKELQLAGKKRLPVSEFLKGFPLTEGTVLGE